MHSSVLVTSLNTKQEYQPLSVDVPCRHTVIIIISSSIIVVVVVVTFRSGNRLA
jgi:hypothetical protein